MGQGKGLWWPSSLSARNSPRCARRRQLQDYAYAMLGVYERNDTHLAAELFAWTYRRSIDKYQVVREAIGAPDPMRARATARKSARSSSW
jgi:hypothetical protein